MARFTDDPAARALGEGLAALRHAAGLSQAEAGSRAGMTSQGWGLYEMGRRPGLFRPDVQRRLTAAIDATPEMLALQTARLGVPPTDVLADGMNSAGRPYRDDVPPLAEERVTVSDDDLAPWADRGVVLVTRPQPPKSGQGCVVTRTDGGVEIGLLERENVDAVALRHPCTGAVRVLDQRVIASVARVTARLEPGAT